MIRPATDALKQNTGESALAIGGLAAALLVPAAVLFVASSADRLAERWLAEYRPVVYLTATTGPDEAEQVADEIRSWSAVAEASVRTPEDAYRRAAERLGERRLTEAAVRPKMFPYSVIVEQEGASADPEVVSRLEGLETRSSVDSVDVPSTRTYRVLGAIDTVWLVGFVLLALLVAGGLVGLGQYLQRLRRRERGMLRLLERFGASGRQLRRATLVRGAVLGVWAGIVATGILLAMALYWRTMEASLLGGVPAATPRNWLVVAAPLVIGPVGGAVVGLWMASRPLKGETHRHWNLHSLLDHG